jgi:hypothetical protein
MNGNLILYDPAGVGYALPLFIKHSLTSLKSMNMEYFFCCRKKFWAYPAISFNGYKISFLILDRWVITTRICFAKTMILMSSSKQKILWHNQFNKITDSLTLIEIFQLIFFQVVFVFCNSETHYPIQNTKFEKICSEKSKIWSKVSFYPWWRFFCLPPFICP